MACLDTSTILDLAGKGGPERKRAAQECLRQLVDAGEAVVTTRFSVAELWVGVHQVTDAGRERSLIDLVKTHLRILGFDDLAARTFGRLRAHLRRIGRPVGDMDLLIASTAIRHQHSLVTRDRKHFAAIPGLMVHTYP